MKDTMKTANEILEEKIWAKWGQTLYGLSDGISGNTLVQMIRPQILEAMESYHKQKLDKPVVSGSGPNDEEMMHLFENITEEDLDKAIQKYKGLRSASGAVDTVAEEEDWDKNIKPIPTAEYKLTIGKIEKIERGASGEGQP